MVELYRHNKSRTFLWGIKKVQNKAKKMSISNGVKKITEAQKIILENISPVGTEQVPILKNLGRTIAKDIYSKDNIPPFDNSAMDGFALRSFDTKSATKNNPVSLKIIEDLPAGYLPQHKVNKGEAIRIMTGAILPKGANCVVMVEETQETGKKGQKAGLVKIFRAIKSAQNIRRKGEDVKKGELTIKKGTLLRPQELGMLAALGVARVTVFRRPRVAILSTGDELVDIRKTLTPGKIRNSNTYALYGQVLRSGAIPVNLGMAKDRPREIREKIKRGLKQDMLIVSAGVSVGYYDVVKEVLKDLGVKIKLWRVAMRPGKPLAFGMIKQVPVFGLPGNPVSSMVTFEQFVRPAIAKMSGRDNFTRLEVNAVTKREIKKKKGFRYFLRGQLEQKNGRFLVIPATHQGSGILSSLVLANCLIVIPEGVTEVKKGETVTVQVLD